MIAVPEVRLDSITFVTAEHRGRVVVAGSHGGRYCGFVAAKAGLLGVILNDAAVGRDDAGIGSLAVLAPLGIPAATVAHDSARIGDAEDMCARGRISHCNEPARLLGCEPGQTCAEAVRRMAARPAPDVSPEPPAGEEARFVLRPAGDGRPAGHRLRFRVAGPARGREPHRRHRLPLRGPPRPPGIRSRGSGARRRLQRRGRGSGHRPPSGARRAGDPGRGGRRRERAHRGSALHLGDGGRLGGERPRGGARGAGRHDRARARGPARLRGARAAPEFVRPPAE